MSNIHNLFPPDNEFDEACDWLAKIDRGLSEEEEQALEDWLAADNAHADQLKLMAELWDQMDSLSRLSALFPAPDARSVLPRRAIAAIAATLLLAIAPMAWLAVNGTAPWRTVTPADQPPDQLLATAVGQQSTTRLPDGSEIILNTDSEASVAFNGYERNVMLDHGEMHVLVAHEEARPFRVCAGGNLVQAVGTSFNLEMTKDRVVELIVTEGRVLVAANASSTQQPQAGDSCHNTSEDMFFVSAGEQVLLNAASETVENVVPELIEAKLSWRKGAIVFRGETLAEAIEEVERYTSVDFVIQDEELEQLRVAGRFRTGDIPELLSALSDNFGIGHYRLSQNKIVLEKSS